MNHSAAKIKELISTTFNIPLEKVTQDMNNDNTPAWDSLGHFRLIQAIEQEFDINIRAHHFVEMTGFKKIEKVLKSYKSK